MSRSIATALESLGPGPLTESGIRDHLAPLFSRSLQFEKDSGLIYLANHSLGRPLDRTAEDVQTAIDLWYSRMDDAWDDDGWPSGIQKFRDGIAKLIGMPDGRHVVPKVSAGQGLRAVLNAIPEGDSRPLKVAASRGEFDSVDVILRTYALRGRVEIQWIEPTVVEGLPLYEADSIVAKAKGCDLLVLSIVAFGTGQVVPDLDGIIRRVRTNGARVLLDAYHAAAVLPIDAMRLDADFLIGGSYKYARGGPGACWFAIHPRNLSLRTLDTGWFAKAEPFRYERPDPPRFGELGDAWLESTPSVLPAYQALAGLEFTLGVGVDRLRSYSLGQLEQLRKQLNSAGVPVLVPERPEDFGAFALVGHPNAASACSELKRRGVVTDARGSFIRFGPDILTTAEQIEQAAEVAGELLGGTL